MCATNLNSLKVVPNSQDIVSAGVAATIAHFERRNKVHEALYQLVASLIGDNLASNTSFAKEFAAKLPAQVSEGDIMTGLIRALASAYEGRSWKEMLKCFLRGSGSRIIGRAVSDQLKLNQ